jgi:hypothetical protein
VLLRRDPDAEVDVGLGVLGLAARPDVGDGLGLGDIRSPLDPERAEVRQRHGVPVSGRDREREAMGGDGACKGHGARGRRKDIRGGATRDVDAAVLTARVRIRSERERAKYRPVYGP